MSSVSKRKRECARAKIKGMGDHKEFLKRITKTLYYGQLPTLACLSLPTTELSCELWSAAQRGRSLRRLYADEAARIARGACVSPCALVLAILYLERLKACNPDYLAATAPADLFLVSLMVSNKFLQDEGERDEVVCAEWAASGGLSLAHLKKLEVQFLAAIKWNVYVSETRFESGLSWLERQVALRQARLRGFFTYTELASTCDIPNCELASALRCASSAWLALALGYVTALVAMVGSTLLVAHAGLATLHHPAAPVALHNNTDAHSTAAPAAPYPTNLTAAYFLADHLEAPPPLARCCSKRFKYRGPSTLPDDGPAPDAWKPDREPRWAARLSLVNWLHRDSLMDSMLWWVARFHRASEFVHAEVLRAPGTGSCDCAAKAESEPGGRCARSGRHRPWMNSLAVALSDR